MATLRAHPRPNSMPRSRTKYGRHWRPTIPGSLYLCGVGGRLHRPHFINALHPVGVSLPHPSTLSPPPTLHSLSNRPTHVSVISTASAMAASLGLSPGLESQPDNSCSIVQMRRE